jgi:hypothetical protein
MRPRGAVDFAGGVEQRDDVIGTVEPHPPWRHGRKSTASALGLVSINQLVFDGGLQDRGQRREHHVDRSRP